MLNFSIGSEVHQIESTFSSFPCVYKFFNRLGFLIQYKVWNVRRIYVSIRPTPMIIVCSNENSRNPTIKNIVVAAGLSFIFNYFKQNEKFSLQLKLVNETLFITPVEKDLKKMFLFKTHFSLVQSVHFSAHKRHFFVSS